MYYRIIYLPRELVMVPEGKQELLANMTVSDESFWSIGKACAFLGILESSYYGVPIFIKGKWCIIVEAES